MNNQSIPYCNPSFILRNAARRTGFLPFTAKRTHDRTLDLSKAPSALTGTFISAVRFGNRLALPFSQHLAGRKGPSSMLSVLATSLHLPLVDTCWAKKGLIRDGKDTLSVERLYVYIVGLTCRGAWLSCDKQRTTFEGA